LLDCGLLVGSSAPAEVKAVPDLLITIPAMGLLVAAAVTAEIGPAPREHSPTAGHLVVWADVSLWLSLMRLDLVSSTPSGDGILERQ
jgi:hypothetical protein